MCPKSLRAKSSRFINHWRSLKYIIRISKELKWLIDDLIEWTSVFSTNCLVWLLYLQATIPLFHLSDHDYLASFIIHDSYILLTRPWFILISFQSSHHYPALSSDISYPRFFHYEHRLYLDHLDRCKIYNNPRTSDQSFRSISTFLQQLSDHSVNIFIRKISFPRTSSISPRAKNARVTIPIAPYKTRVKKRVEWPKASRKWSGKDHGKGRQSARAAVTTLRDVLAWCSGETRARGWKGVEKGRISGDGWCELNHGGRFSVYVGRIRNFQPSPISRYTLLHGNKIYAEKFSFNLNPGFSSGEQRYPQWNCKTIRFIVEYRCSIVKYCRVIALGRPRFTGNEMFHASQSFFISIGRIFIISQSWILIIIKG